MDHWNKKIIWNSTRPLVLRYEGLIPGIARLQVAVVALQESKRTATGGEVPDGQQGTALPVGGLVASSAFRSGVELASRIGWGRRWFFHKSDEDKLESENSVARESRVVIPKPVSAVRAPVSSSSTGNPGPVRRHPFVRRAATEPNVIVCNLNRRRSSLGKR
jgi:hypothetical protein